MYDSIVYILYFILAMFCSSVVSCFLNDLDMVPDTPAITGTTFDFTFHVRCIFTIIIIIIILLLCHCCCHLHVVIRLFYLLYFMEVKQNERGAASSQELVSLMV